MIDPYPGEMSRILYHRHDIVWVQNIEYDMSAFTKI